MKRKAIISIDLASMVGTLKVKMPSNPLPRRNKSELEIRIANRLLYEIKSRSSHSIGSLRGCSDDPPDVLFEFNNVTTGIELTELLPPNRLERDAIIKSIKEKIISGINTGDNTRNRIVNIFFKEDYSVRFRPKKCIGPLVQILNETFNALSQDQCLVPVPSELENTISRIHISTEDLTEDERIKDENQPLLIFGAQHTQIVPDQDIPLMFDMAFSRKLQHDLAGPTWLLVWTTHLAIGAVREDILSRITPYLSLQNIRYNHVFYLDLTPPEIVLHIPGVEKNEIIFTNRDTT